MCVRLIGGEPGRYGYNYFVSMIMERLGLLRDLVLQAIWRLDFRDGLSGIQEDLVIQAIWKLDFEDSLLTDVSRWTECNIIEACVYVFNWW